MSGFFRNNYETITSKVLLARRRDCWGSGAVFAVCREKNESYPMLFIFPVSARGDGVHWSGDSQNHVDC